MNGNSLTGHTDVCQSYITRLWLRTHYLPLGCYYALLGLHRSLIYGQGYLCTAWMYSYRKFNRKYIIQSEDTHEYQVPEERRYVTVLSPSGFINQFFKIF